MTPLEWITCDDPERLLRYLHEPKPYRLSSQHRQMFAVACCRRVWDRLDRLSQRVVEVAERYAQGQADIAACREVYRALKASPPENVIAAYAALGTLMCPTDGFSGEFMSQAASDAAYRFVRSAAASSAMLVGSVVPHALHSQAAWDAAGKAERAAQCELLRAIVGNRWRRNVQA
jgi:hypothetical protein